MKRSTKAIPSRPSHSRRFPLAASLLLCAAVFAGSAGAAPSGDAPDLGRLGALVRGGDAHALARLRQVEPAFGDGKPYADQVAYLKLLAQACLDAGQFDAAYAVDERIARLATVHGDTANAAIGALGRVGQLAATDPTAALEALGAIDARYTQLSDPQFVATVQQLYGDLYVALGQFDFALGHYLKALEVARAHPGLLHPTVAGLRVLIARVYTYTHAPDKVLTALPDAGREGGGLPPLARARVFMYKGIAEIMRGQMDAARGAFGQSLAVSRPHGLLVEEADVLANISDSYLEEHRYPEAESAAREAIAVAERSADAQPLRIANVNLGFALLGQGRFAEGLATIERVKAEMRKAGTLPDLADVLAEESRALERAGRLKQALAVLREREEITAHLASSEREKTVAVLQEQFNAQQRAIQIDGLRRENAVKDQEIQQRRLWQLIASIGAGLALLLCGFVFRLYRRSQRTQRRLEELNAELAFHSTHDALTGLLNRRSFRERMLAREEGGEAMAAECFILLDIDHFKLINDRHGHGAGDEVLVEVARRLRDTLGERGLVMRWGGEEFLVYVDSIARSGHAALVRELLDALAGSPVAVEGEGLLAVTVTAGALSLPARRSAREGDGGTDGRGWQQAIALADQALYKGKQGGRNRACLVEGPGAAATRYELILPRPELARGDSAA